jgi:hypothetical protein
MAGKSQLKLVSDCSFYDGWCGSFFDLSFKPIRTSGRPDVFDLIAQFLEML